MAEVNQNEISGVQNPNKQGLNQQEILTEENRQVNDQAGEQIQNNHQTNDDIQSTDNLKNNQIQASEVQEEIKEAEVNQPVNQQVVQQEESKQQNNQDTLTSNIRIPQPSEAPILNIEQPQPNTQPAYTLKQRIDDANTMKAQGNDYYKNADYNLAIFHYYEGLKILDPVELNKGSLELIQESRQIAFSLILNIAQAHIKLGNFSQAIVCASEVLHSEPRHFKALFRRALSYFEVGKLEQALQDIKLAYEVDPTNREGIQAYRKIGEAYAIFNKKQKEEQKQIYKNMFNKAEKSQKSQKTDITNSTNSRKRFSLLKFITFGSLSAGAAYFLTKHSSLEKTTQVLVIGGAGVSGSLFGISGVPAKILGGIGLIAIGAFLYSKK